MAFTPKLDYWGNIPPLSEGDPEASPKGEDLNRYEHGINDNQNDIAALNAAMADVPDTYATKVALAEAVTGEPLAITDGVVETILSDPVSQSAQTLSATFVGLDNLVPLPESGSKFKRDTVTATTTGALRITLGATPSTDSENVWIDGILTDSYTLSGNEVDLTLTSGDVVRIQYAYTGEDADDATVATVLVSDSFNRVDSTTGLGNADSGHAWTSTTFGDFGIASNEAYLVSSDSSADVAFVDAGVADCTVEAKLSAGVSSMGLALRATSGADFLATRGTTLYRRISGGGFTDIGTFSTPFVAGDSIRAVMAGSQITIYRQAGSVGAWVEVLSVTETSHQTVTTHGIFNRSNLGTDGRLDDLLVLA